MAARIQSATPRTQAGHAISLDEFLTLPDDGARHEYVRGEVRTMPPPKGDHGLIESDLLAEINHYLDGRARTLGWTPEQGREAKRRLVGFVAGGEFGLRFALPDDRHQIRGADGVYISPETYTRIPWNRDEYFPSVPDLVMEIISPTDTADAVGERVEDYLSGGAHRVWCVYRQRRCVVVYDPDAPMRVVHEDGVLTDDDLLPGFALPLHDLFAR